MSEEETGGGSKEAVYRGIFDIICGREERLEARSMLTENMYSSCFETLSPVLPGD